MRRLIWYLRTCFCKHEFEYAECRCRQLADGTVEDEEIVVSLICTKCGYHETFSKFSHK